MSQAAVALIVGARAPRSVGSRSQHELGDASSHARVLAPVNRRAALAHGPVWESADDVLSDRAIVRGRGYRASAVRCDLTDGHRVDHQDLFSDGAAVAGPLGEGDTIGARALSTGARGRCFRGATRKSEEG